MSDMTTDYPIKKDGTLNLSLKAAKEYALSTGDHGLLMAAVAVESLKAKASVFAASVDKIDDRIETLQRKLDEAEEIKAGGQAEAEVLRHDAAIEKGNFEEYVRENHG